jgi:acyl carrier protein
MISAEEFTNELVAEFEEVEPNTVFPDTNYRDIKNWSSMYALIIIAFVDANFDVQLTADDLKNTQTVRDLYNIVKENVKE